MHHRYTATWLHRQHCSPVIAIFPVSVFPLLSSRTCIIALLRSSLAAYQKLPQHQHSLQSQPHFAAAAFRFHASFRYDASFATASASPPIFAAPPSPLTPLGHQEELHRYEPSPHSKLGFAVSLRSAARIASSKQALHRKTALRYLLDQRRLYPEELAQCDLFPDAPSLHRFIHPHGASHPRHSHSSSRLYPRQPDP